MKYRPRTKPYPHQRMGLQFLWKNKGGGLWFQPGTGKTKVAVDYAAAMHDKGICGKVLIICPINALQVWPDQIELHLPERFLYDIIVPDGSVAQKAQQVRDFTDDHHPDTPSFLILNYEATIQRDRQWDIMRALEEYDADLVVFDESQKIKNATAARSKAAHRLGRQARRVVLLTGTPLGKGWLDMYSQLKAHDETIWTHPTKSKIMSWTEFRHYYATWGGRSGYELRSYQNLDDLKRRYKPHIRTAVRMGNLPPVTDRVVPILMPDRAKSAYDSFAVDGVVVIQNRLVEAAIPLTKLLRLQEMSGGSVHDEHGTVVEVHRSKLDTLVSLVEELYEANRQAVIFARFIWEMNEIQKAIAARLERGGHHILAIRGGVPAKQRTGIVNGFIDGRVPYLIMQIASAEAIDGLQRVCSDGIFYSTDYSWEHYAQARGRLDRTGQTTPVVFHHLHMIGTVDKLVYSALGQKRDLERMVIEDPELLFRGI